MCRNAVEPYRTVFELSGTLPQVDDGARSWRDRSRKLLKNHDGSHLAADLFYYSSPALLDLSVCVVEDSSGDVLYMLSGEEPGGSGFSHD